ncbi:hypothetical protein [Tenacibaculum sp. 190524A02b]|uniref:hypothetical protein n=1 Tax=Tenacibaculum vairaonense TaxID=3137860 RepID=UPI0032B12E8E
MQNKISNESKQEWEEGVEQIYKYFIKNFDYKPNKLEINIFYFTNQKSFEKYQLQNLKRKRISRTGFYSPQKGSFYMINKNNNSPIAKNIFLHESIHRIFNSEIMGEAILLNEGMATLFQTIYKDNNDFYVGINQKQEKSLKDIIRNKELFDLKTFFSISNLDWQKNNKISYPQSNSLIYFLLIYNPNLLNLIVKDYKKQPNKRKGYEKIIEENYINGMEGFEKKWKKWILKENKQPVKLNV